MQISRCVESGNCVKRAKTLFISCAPLCSLSDIAIGCPYGGEEQQGLVLIYHGDAKGLKDTPTQTLSGHWASSSFPSHFGFALRGNTDLDLNGYPGTAFHSLGHIQQNSPLGWLTFFLKCPLVADLVVGAFGADKSVLFRCVESICQRDRFIPTNCFVVRCVVCLHSGLDQ